MWLCPHLHDGPLVNHGLDLHGTEEVQADGVEGLAAHHEPLGRQVAHTLLLPLCTSVSAVKTTFTYMEDYAVAG